MNSNAPLILASASPRRMELLTQIGIKPDKIIPANIDETAKSHEKPRNLVKRLSLEKAQKIHQSHKDAYVLAADTLVSIGGKDLGKPENPQIAAQYICALSGRRHDVLSGITLIAPNRCTLTRTVKTIVKVKRLSETEIKSYINTNEWEGKAGAYGIQGDFAKYIKEIQGSYTNIVGLCLHTTYKMLIGAGYQVL